MSRHAYLIMAHGEPMLLKLLIHALDHPNNDIFLHVDKKVELLTDQEIRNLVRFASIQVFRRYTIAWGGDTQIKCELFLLSKAVQTKHVYYHFLSGVDIPLCSQDAIHSFFGKNLNYNYISFNYKATKTQDFLHRIRYYRLLQNKIGRVCSESPAVIKLLNKIEGLMLCLQKKLSIDRVKANPYLLAKGSSWFSITHNFALYLVGEQRNIIKFFGYSIGGDEVFCQSIIMSSEYADTVFSDNLRYIDWSESDLPGAPKTLCMQDYEKIINSGKMFARKFSAEKDTEVIMRLYSRLEQQ